MIVDLQKSLKMDRKFWFPPHSTSSNVNILGNHATCIKIKTLTW